MFNRIDIIIFYLGVVVKGIAIGSDGHDKPFCTKAMTITDNFKKFLGDTDNNR